MKNKVQILLSLLLTVLIAVSTSGCDDDAKLHVHEDAGCYPTPFFLQVVTFDSDGEKQVIEDAMTGWSCLSVGQALRERDIITETGFVNTVMGITADWNVDQSWWAFHVDDVFSDYGIEEVIIETGATYAFVYTQG